MKRIDKPVLLVVFGASGDLSKRKLIPALYHLAYQNLLPPNFTVIGFARTHYTDEQFRALALEGVREFGSAPLDETIWHWFSQGLFYQTGNYDDLASFKALAECVATLDKQRHTAGNHVYYLATPPSVFHEITTLIHEAGLCAPNPRPESPSAAHCRVVIEKPFGQDLASAQKLNEHLLSLFSEEQIYRIDHYLGKETVQNILVFRFGNGIFEPIWNRNYIDHIQITVAETLGIGDRGGYYDKAGAIRDMVQNHMMQLLSFTAMEPPVVFDPKAVRDQKVNVLRAIRPLKPEEVERSVVRAQYGPGVSDGKEVPGYTSEKGVPADSTTDTYVAWKLEIDSWRWKGVPFYLRTGKALAAKVTEVNIVFRKPPLMLFETMNGDKVPPSNVLTLRIQPDEGIRLSFDAKRPGPSVIIERVAMDFSYREQFGSQPSADAYERLLLDAIAGDTTLFIRRDEVELAWYHVTRVLEGWEAQEQKARKQDKKELVLPKYAAGTWGPKEADELLARDGRYWRNPTSLRLLR
ncbi:MAG TPA: glucose-6-phosphate dehydrogenase [Caldilineaceae bacterium]|nr:glucose-6-phosphate dehydrogenase [Caldilineaceae bacterium]